MNDIKIIVPVAKSHLTQLELNSHFMPKYHNDITFICNNEIINDVHKLFPKSQIIDEDKMPGLDTNKIKDIFMTRCGSLHRYGWYLQQFIKLNFANIYNGDYISFDSDTIQLKPIPFKYEDKYIFNQRQERDLPYFDTIMKLFPETNVLSKNSFIAEYMIFNSTYVKEMLSKIGNDWYMKILDSVGNGTPEDNAKHLNACGFSEFETYGTYMMNNHPDKMALVFLNTWRYGKSIFGKIPTYEEFIEKHLPFDLISFENW